MPAELCRKGAADPARRQFLHGLDEVRRHTLASEPAEIASQRLGAFVLGMQGRQFGECLFPGVHLALDRANLRLPVRLGPVMPGQEKVRRVMRRRNAQGIAIFVVPGTRFSLRDLGQAVGGLFGDPLLVELRLADRFTQGRRRLLHRRQAGGIVSLPGELTPQEVRLALRSLERRHRVQTVHDAESADDAVVHQILQHGPAGLPPRLRAQRAPVLAALPKMRPDGLFQFQAGQRPAIDLRRSPSPLSFRRRAAARHQPRVQRPFARIQIREQVAGGHEIDGKSPGKTSKRERHSDGEDRTAPSRSQAPESADQSDRIVQFCECLIADCLSDGHKV